jgi:hypothetical protein
VARAFESVIAGVGGQGINGDDQVGPGSGGAEPPVPWPPGGPSRLAGVKVNPVGSIGTDTGNATLIERWNGTSWTQVTSPSAGTSDPNAVTATSASNAWAAGFTPADDGIGPLFERWNGSAWSMVTSPALSPGTSGDITALAAASANDTWAVGVTSTAAGTRTLAGHWNGTSWAVVPSVNANGESDPHGVAATSATDAWIVGGTLPTPTQQLTLSEHWNGSKWTVTPGP